MGVNLDLKDFNNQWKLQGELNSDYWASDEILVDQFSGIFSISFSFNDIKSHQG